MRLRSKSLSAASRVGASVTVITGEELETYNYERIEDALRQVPGVDVQRSGGPGKTTSIRIRGASSNQVQIMVDGMRVKSPTLGTADLSELTLDATNTSPQEATVRLISYLEERGLLALKA